jgi:AsmA protein
VKTVKILGGIVGVAVLLVVSVLVAVTVLVNPNNYKGRIAAAVKESTGRELTLQGDIKLSVFPWVALELGPATLSNPPGFGDEPFLAFQRAAVRVKLLPLLHEDLQVARVELDGLDLRLRKNAAGKGNWERPEPAAQPEPPASQGGDSHLKLESIAGVKVTHGRVSFNEYTLQNIDLETGAISEKRDVPITLSFDGERGVKGEALQLTAKLNLEDNPDTDDLKLEAFSVSGTLSRQDDGRPMHYEIGVPTLDANLKQQTVTVPDFSLSLSSLHLTGKLTATQISENLHASGSLALQSLVLGEFAPRFHIDLPKTRDPKALSSLSAGMNFTYDGKRAAFTDLQFKLDDSTLKGSLEATLEPALAVKFALVADRIDLDRYRPPAGAKPDPKSAAANKPAPKTAEANSAPLTAAGTFSLAAAHAGGLDFTNLNVTVDMKDNVTHLHPLAAQLYGGSYSGDLTYDARTASPSISMDEHLSGVDMTQLAANTKAKGRVSGKANIDIKATARGAESDDILKTLTGHFDANVANGAIEGVDVGYELALAQSLLDKQSSTPVTDTKRTKFDAFKVSAVITNGIAETHDLSIVSPVLKVSGQGTINLPSSGLDMNLTASIMKSAGTTALDIPLKITGTYSDPTVTPDMEGLAKGAIKDKLKDVLKKNGLDGLFGH